MAELIIDVCEVDKVITHPHADALEIVPIKGWQVVTGLGQFKPGDKVVYFPPDTILPLDVSDDLGVTRYLSKGRVRGVRLRQVPSYGFVAPLPEGLDWQVGWNVAEYYRAEKYVPPVRSTDGDSETPNPLFHEYTSIEHLGHFPEMFQEGDTVSVTEKIHGCNCRLGKVMVAGEWEYMAGSHRVRRRQFNDKGAESRYWKPMTENIKRLLDELSEVELPGGEIVNSAIIYGEIYGSGIQDMAYGMTSGQTRFAVFDISINGQYQAYRHVSGMCRQFEIETVPGLYMGAFSRDLIDRWLAGSTTVAENVIGFQGKEGIVIRPYYQERVFEGQRAIAKVVSVDYLARKDQQKWADE